LRTVTYIGEISSYLTVWLQICFNLHAPTHMCSMLPR